VYPDCNIAPHCEKRNYRPERSIIEAIEGTDINTVFCKYYLGRRTDLGKGGLKILTL